MRVSEFESCRAVRCNVETGRDPQALEPPPRPHLLLERQDMGRGLRGVVRMRTPEAELVVFWYWL